MCLQNIKHKMKILILLIAFIALGALFKTYKVTVKKINVIEEEVLKKVRLEKELENEIKKNAIQIYYHQNTLNKNNEFQINHNFSVIELLIINVLIIIIIFFALYFKIKFID